MTRTLRARHTGRAARRWGPTLAAVVAGAAAAPSPAVSADRSIDLRAVPAEVRSGGTFQLSGTLVASRDEPVGGGPVELQVDPYPYRGFFDARHTTAAPDGSFTFGALRPDRNTRYRVRSGARVSDPVVVYVDVPAVLHSSDRGPGRTVLTMLSRHSAYFRWIGVPVFWYVAPAAGAGFRLAAVTRTRELRPGLTYATATVDPPSRRFVYRVCFNGVGEAGAGPPAAHARCPRGATRG